MSGPERTRMNIHDIKPTPELRSFISGYKIIESDTDRINRVLPDTSLALAFRLRGENTYHKDDESKTLPTITVSGLRKSPRLIGYASNTSTLVVRFKVGGASAFFRDPLHHLFAESVSLDELIPPSEVSKINDQIHEASNYTEAIAIVERFLLRMISQPASDKLVTAAVDRITHSNGFVRIRELADDLCISQDAFEKRFRKIVGATPKQFASIVRLSTIVKHTRQRDQLLDAALNTGFFDQAHFIKAFKEFTGQTPSEFIQSGQAW